MATEVSGWTLGELAVALGGELAGPSDLRVTRPVPVDSDNPQGLTFAETADYLRQAEAGGAAAILAPRGSDPAGKPKIFVDKPREAFGRFLAMNARPLPIEAGIHPMAIVSPTATVAASASVGPYAVIESGAIIGENCRIYPFCYVGENCTVGDKSILYPHAVLYQDVQVGARAVVHAGAVLGADGFGFAWDGQRHLKIPQVGGVRLSDDVEIGALTAVDRATAGDTQIGKGTKLDNLIQVGHNTRIGDNTVIASQTGISGSTKIGSRVTIAGQSATNDHITICDDVVLGGRSGVTGNITKAGTYFGLPARPLGEAMRNLMLYTKLQDLFKRVKDLEKKSQNS